MPTANESSRQSSRWNRVTHMSVVVDYKKCSGCRLCEVTCSMRGGNPLRPSESRIRVLSFSPGVDITVVCRQCEVAPCISACPVGALQRDEKTGAVTLEEATCTGCQACIPACPAEAIFLNERRGLALKCDLCGGSPKCVGSCPLGALEFCLTQFDAREGFDDPKSIARDLRRSLAILET